MPSRDILSSIADVAASLNCFESMMDDSCRVGSGVGGGETGLFIDSCQI